MSAKRIKRRGDIPVPHVSKAGVWKTPAPDIDPSAVKYFVTLSMSKGSKGSKLEILEKTGV